MTTYIRKLAADKLSIFRIDTSRHCLLYTPGYGIYLRTPDADNLEIELLTNPFSSIEDVVNLRKYAEKAQAGYSNWLARPYCPVCLTLYLNNTCNLSCAYCYSQIGDNSNQRVQIEEIIVGAKFVARNCVEQGKPLTVVFHGGGEPALDFGLIQTALKEVYKIAGQNHLEVFRYIATNGVMSTGHAEWIARNFDLVGLSCDGPRSIQDKQRPLRIDIPQHKNGSSSFVERTAQILRKNEVNFDIRVTITPHSVDRQPEIAHYICDTLRPREIHAEPVYMRVRGSDPAIFPAEMAECFVSRFLEAREVSMKMGIPWYTSGTRIDEVNGPYCNYYRDVLNIIPGGWITACFKVSKLSFYKDHPLIIGWIDKHIGKITIDHNKLTSLREGFTYPLSQCETCFNRFHCTYLCPDYCVCQSNTVNKQSNEHNRFRCMVASMLAMKFIEEKAIHKENE